MHGTAATSRTVRRMPVAKEDVITMDRVALAELVSARVDAELSKRSAAAPEPNDPTMRRLRDAERLNAEPRDVTYHKMISPVTGASFTAKVVRSRAHPMGRTVNIGENSDGHSDYEEPPTYTTHLDDGGMVPNNIAIKNTNGFYTAEYMKWKSQNNPWVQDLRAFVGKPWNEYYSLEARTARTSP